jgi:pilus assembly protein Flp/PilA
MKAKVMAFLRDEEGLTIVEYAVAAGLISAAVVVAFTNLGTTILGIINGLITALGGTP